MNLQTSIIFSLITTLLFIKGNESIVNKFFSNGNFMQIMQYTEGSILGEAAAQYVPETSSSGASTRLLTGVDNAIAEMSTKICELCPTNNGQTLLVGVNPNYFDSNATEHASDETSQYMYEMQIKLQQFQQSHSCVVSTKFMPKLGIFKVNFASFSEKTEVQEALNEIWSENNKVWLMEFDGPVTHYGTVKGPKLKTHTPTNINAASNIPDPHPSTKWKCPVDEFNGPYDYPTVNDYFFNMQWYLESSQNYDVNALEFWNEVSNHTVQTLTPLAIIDTGLDGIMEDFIGKLWENPGEIAGNGIDDDNNGYIDDTWGWNLWADSNQLYDIDFGNHGTACSGIALATTNNFIGVAGIAGSQVKLVSFVSGTVGDKIEGINYCLDNNIKISSNSWGVDSIHYASLYDTLLSAETAGHLYVNAAANAATDLNTYVDYPPSYNLSNFITVGASDIEGYVAYFSDYAAPYLHVFAPGQCITTTAHHKNNEDWYFVDLEGTSMATPLVAGVAAQILAIYPTLTSAQLKESIMNTCYTSPHMTTEHVVCGGIIDPTAALQYAGTLITTV